MSSPSLSHPAQRYTAASTDLPLRVEYLLLFIPYLLSFAFVADPLLSYFISWAGSGFIFVASVQGWIKPLPQDLPVTTQLLRPIFVVQAVFAGFFCLSSVFYVWEIHALEAGWMPLPDEEMALVAEAQRHYVLGHAAFVTGLLALMDYKRDETWRFSLSFSFPELLVVLGIGFLAASAVIGQVGFLNQFAIKFQTVGAIAVVMSFAVSIIRGRLGMILLLGGVYVTLFVSALLSGWKHEVIAVSGLLMLFLLPRYRRTVTAMGLAFVLFATTLLPAYNTTFRGLSSQWNGTLPPDVAAAESVRRIADGEVDISEQSWNILSGRTTEIGLFTRYIEHTPERRPYYGLQIAEQAILSIIPRAFWPDKPITEEVVMDRVYENNAIQEYSSASAKPQLVVDAYLSGGAFGVLLVCFLLGLAFSWTSRLAERYLGGYRFGTAVVYTGLFATLILTNSFEFFANTFFWSCVTLAMTFTALKLTGLIYRDPTPVNA